MFPEPFWLPEDYLPLRALNRIARTDTCIFAAGVVRFPDRSPLVFLRLAVLTIFLASFQSRTLAAPNHVCVAIVASPGAVVGIRWGNNDRYF